MRAFMSKPGFRDDSELAVTRLAARIKCTPNTYTTGYAKAAVVSIDDLRAVLAERTALAMQESHAVLAATEPSIMTAHGTTFETIPQLKAVGDFRVRILADALRAFVGEGE